MSSKDVIIRCVNMSLKGIMTFLWEGPCVAFGWEDGWGNGEGDLGGSNLISLELWRKLMMLTSDIWGNWFCRAAYFYSSSTLSGVWDAALEYNVLWVDGNGAPDLYWGLVAWLVNGRGGRGLGRGERERGIRSLWGKRQGYNRLTLTRSGYCFTRCPVTSDSGLGARVRVTLTWTGSLRRGVRSGVRRGRERKHISINIKAR